MKELILFKTYYKKTEIKSKIFLKEYLKNNKFI
jgi:hypothetical protein